MQNASAISDCHAPAANTGIVSDAPAFGSLGYNEMALVPETLAFMDDSAEFIDFRALLEKTVAATSRVVGIAAFAGTIGFLVYLVR